MPSTFYKKEGFRNPNHKQRNNSLKLFKIIKEISRIFSSSNNPSKSITRTQSMPSTYSSVLNFYECSCHYHGYEREKIQKRRNILHGQELRNKRVDCDEISISDYSEDEEATFEERQSLEQRAEEFIRRFYEDQRIQQQIQCNPTNRV